MLLGIQALILLCTVLCLLRLCIYYYELMKLGCWESTRGSKEPT